MGLLAIAAFVVFPLLPDRTFDPWHSLNPHRLWGLVVAVMSIASAGYFALRLFGARYGMTLAGLAGGFVSSTATVAVMAQRARDEPRLTGVAASAAVMSNVGTIVQMAFVVGTLSFPLLERLAVAMVSAGVAAVLAASIAQFRSLAARVDVGKLAGERPFELLTVIRFVALLAGIVLVTAVLRSHVGNDRLPWLMVLSGLADVHAAAASAAQAVAAGQVATHIGAVSVLVAFTANAALKCALASFKGGFGYARRVVPGILGVAATFAAGTLMTPA